jgi:hypothetical protein
MGLWSRTSRAHALANYFPALAPKSSVCIQKGRMQNIHWRILLFLIGCIGTRLLITWFAYHVLVATRNKHRNTSRVMGTLGILIAIGFFFIYFTGARKTGAEVFGDRIWWNDLRPVHGLIFLVFGLSVITEFHVVHAWKLLLLDAMIGLVAFSIHHQSNR